MAKVSIIVPVYNVESYVARCLDSCLCQTLDDIEVICVNDGSTDLSSYILEHYKNFDSRVKIINKPNGGLSSARNVGVENAKGEYILFVDSDDYISSTSAEILYNNAKENNADVVIFDYAAWNTKLNCVNVYSNKPNNQDYSHTTFNCDTMEPDCYKFIFVATWTKLYKTEFIKNIKFTEGIIYEDVPFWAEVYTKAERITYLPEPLYFYRTNRTGRIMAHNGEKMFDVVTALNKAEKAFKENGKWDRYKHCFQMIMMNDYLKKLSEIKPELREKLFNLFKSQNLDIDFEYYTADKILPFELHNVKLFKLLTKAKDFKEFLLIQNEVHNA